MILRILILIIMLLNFTYAYSEENTQRKNIIIRKSLLTAMVNSKELNKVEIKEINFAPSQSAGLHMHPIPVVGYIVEGAILFQIEGQPSKILHAGDAFYEPANIKIIHFDNIAQGHSKFIAFYLLGKNDHDLIRML